MRHRLTAEHGVLPEFVEIELRRVMDQVFEIPSRAEDALTKDRAPSGGEGIFGSEIDTSAAKWNGGNGMPVRYPEDDLSIPEFLRRTAEGVP